VPSETPSEQGETEKEKEEEIDLSQLDEEKATKIAVKKFNKKPKDVGTSDTVDLHT
jgi:hypothetical protein